MIPSNWEVWQEGQKFKVILGFLEKLKPVSAVQDPCIKNKNKTRQTNQPNPTAGSHDWYKVRSHSLEREWPSWLEGPTAPCCLLFSMDLP